jgi:hypothetical protein
MARQMERNRHAHQEIFTLLREEIDKRLPQAS